MGIIPDCSIQEIDENEMVGILLPGAETWVENAKKAILERVVSYVEKGILVAAICGATLVLADLGILDSHLHTSNSLEYLCGFSKNYKGQAFYRNECSIADQNIITASSAGSLLWARKIIEYLNRYPSSRIESWY